ncbi:CARDB domain-containing protein, partial [Thiorhodococcus fuscus]
MNHSSIPARNRLAVLRMPARLVIAAMLASVCVGTALAASGPDLVISAVSAPASGPLEGEIPVTATLTNQGDATASPSLLLFFFSSDDTITLDDVQDGWGGCYMPELIPGASATCQDTAPIPAALTAGRYYLGAYADTQEIVAELDETNNGLAADHSTLITNALAEDYFLKVNAYYHGALGRAATPEELDTWGGVLLDNSGSVWKPAGGAGLQPYLSSLTNWGTDPVDAATAGARVDSVLTNLFGSADTIDVDIKTYYTQALVQGVIRERGLVNAIL